MIRLAEWRIVDAKPFRGKRRFRPNAGEFAIFSSYFVHRVYPNETEEKRVTIVFNATFRKPNVGS